MHLVYVIEFDRKTMFLVWDSPFVDNALVVSFIKIFFKQ